MNEGWVAKKTAASWPYPFRLVPIVMLLAVTSCAVPTDADEAASGRSSQVDDRTPAASDLESTISQGVVESRVNGSTDEILDALAAFAEEVVAESPLGFTTGSYNEVSECPVLPQDSAAAILTVYEPRPIQDSSVRHFANLVTAGPDSTPNPLPNVQCALLWWEGSARIIVSAIDGDVSEYYQYRIGRTRNAREARPMLNRSTFNGGTIHGLCVASEVAKLSYCEVLWQRGPLAVRFFLSGIGAEDSDLGALDQSLREALPIILDSGASLLRGNLVVDPGNPFLLVPVE